jgi:lysophosphatidylcholine acyltransferase / lyso-PAF acetyltransferase
MSNLKGTPYERQDKPRTLKDNVLLAIGAVTLFPVRAFLIISILLLGWPITKIFVLLAVQKTRKNECVGGWKRRLYLLTMYPLFWGLSLGLGCWRIRVHRSTTGPQDGERPFAPVIVSNHISYADIPLLMLLELPSIVAKSDTAAIPFIGFYARAWQCVFVDRSGKVPSVDLIRQRQIDINKNKDAGWPRLAIFAEGTTTNGRSLIQFQRGGFMSGLPVQPYVLSYRSYSWFSPAFESMNGLPHLFYTLSTLGFAVDILELPVYVPSEEERANPALYAENVRKAMGTYAKMPLADTNCWDKLALLGRGVHRKVE